MKYKGKYGNEYVINIKHKYKNKNDNESNMKDKCKSKKINENDSSADSCKNLVSFYLH